ncbi:hypothetical protein SAMN05216446_0540, partial [Parafannyhessea umbonata]
MGKQQIAMNGSLAINGYSFNAQAKACTMDLRGQGVTTLMRIFAAALVVLTLLVINPLAAFADEAAGSADGSVAPTEQQVIASNDASYQQSDSGYTSEPPTTQIALQGSYSAPEPSASYPASNSPTEASAQVDTASTATPESDNSGVASSSEGEEGENSDDSDPAIANASTNSYANASADSNDTTVESSGSTVAAPGTSSDASTINHIDSNAGSSHGNVTAGASDNVSASGQLSQSPVTDSVVDSNAATSDYASIASTVAHATSSGAILNRADGAITLHLLNNGYSVFDSSEAYIGGDGVSDFTVTVTAADGALPMFYRNQFSASGWTNDDLTNEGVVILPGDDSMPIQDLIDAGVTDLYVEWTSVPVGVYYQSNRSAGF